MYYLSKNFKQKVKQNWNMYNYYKTHASTKTSFASNIRLRPNILRIPLAILLEFRIRRTEVLALEYRKYDYTQALYTISISSADHSLYITRSAIYKKNNMPIKETNFN